MLTHIHIENYTIIDSLDLEFGGGMTVLTGETGAGKSIIIDALELVLGGRADSKAIRIGKQRCDIIASFAVAHVPTVQHWLAIHEFDTSNDECILRRTLHQDGRSKCYLNDRPISLQSSRELGALLVNIHGQHEHQSLLKRDEQRNLLDTFAGQIALAEKIARTATEWSTAQARLNVLEHQGQEQTAKLDLLRYQIQELDELELAEDELIQLEQEHKQLANAEHLMQQYQQLVTLLEESENINALGLLHHADQILTAVQSFDARLSSTHELLTNAIIQIQEVAHDIRQHWDTMEQDPSRLLWVEQRLQKIYDTARKHRVSPSELYQHYHALLDQLSIHVSSDEQLSALKQQIERLQQEYVTLATRLSANRYKIAQQLSEQVTLSMQQLGMPGGHFSVVLEPNKSTEPNPKGLERVEFFVATNPGQNAQPLNKIASGGELSRISLAIQVITADKDSTATLIFDEVDVGIGGSTAAIVGQLLRKLGAKAQVLCITHLPQVAACGHQHYQVKKTTANEVTYTQIQVLSKQEKVREIARMLGGLKITEQTIAHAQEMLDTV